MNYFKSKPIIILGGMGPQASSRLLEAILLKCSSNGCRENYEFPEIILDSIPVPDFMASKEKLGIAKKMLVRRVKQLAMFDPLCFGIACNTAHLIIDLLQKKSGSPFISVVDEVANKVSSREIKRVGLLATPTTISSSLYQNALFRKGIETILPLNPERIELERIIRNVIAKKSNKADIKKLMEIKNYLIKRGARGIILGCTELPLIFPRKKGVFIFDSIDILAEAFMQRIFNKKN